MRSENNNNINTTGDQTNEQNRAEQRPKPIGTETSRLIRVVVEDVGALIDGWFHRCQMDGGDSAR